MVLIWIFFRGRGDFVVSKICGPSNWKVRDVRATGQTGEEDPGRNIPPISPRGVAGRPGEVQGRSPGWRKESGSHRSV